VSRERPEDLFDVFEPWTEHGSEAAVEPGAGVPEPPSMRRPRKRIGPRIPPPAGPPKVPDPVDDPAGFMRAAGIPEIDKVARRLKAGDHQIRVQDLLDLVEPELRVLFWPQPGLMDPDDRTRATLEFIVNHGEVPEIEARYWLGSDPEARTVLGAVPLERLDVAWFRGRVLDFVEATLGGL
jgi:hypothetical protein